MFAVDMTVVRDTMCGKDGGVLDVAWMRTCGEHGIW